jgi:hypothetical protein
LKVKVIVKIYSFYISNIKNKLAYFTSQQYTEDEIHKMINESTFLQFEKKNEIDNRRNTPILNIPNHEVRVLIIKEMFNLKDAAKCLYNDDENSDDSDINENISDNESNGENEDVEMESNYDVEELIKQYSIDNELEENTL